MSSHYGKLGHCLPFLIWTNPKGIRQLVLRNPPKDSFACLSWIFIARVSGISLACGWRGLESVDGRASRVVHVCKRVSVCLANVKLRLQYFDLGKCPSTTSRRWLSYVSHRTSRSIKLAYSLKPFCNSG